MTIIGRWLSEDEFHTPPKKLLTEQDLYDGEADRTDKQAKFIMDLMIQRGYKRIEDIHSSFKTKSNGKISIGMAGKIIDHLKNET